MLKIPAATVTVDNKAGRFTKSSSEDYIPIWSKFRIRADVRGFYDIPFWGRYVRYEGAMLPRRHDLSLILKGHAVKLLHDAITYDYKDDYDGGDPWTMKTVIQDFLANPDTGYDTGISLITDSGDITTEPPIDNFDKEKLLNALRKIGEKINYDGYLLGEYDLYFKEVGTEPVTPTTDLAHPFLEVRPVYDTEEIENLVLPWGDVEAGVPPDMDRWTEDYDRWAGLWTADSGCTVVDDDAQKYQGNRSIKITSDAAVTIVGATLDITKDPDCPNGIDCSGDRFVNIKFVVRHNYTSLPILGPTIDLIDDAGTPATIRFGEGTGFWFHPGIKANKWSSRYKEVGPSTEIVDTYLDSNLKLKWWYASGSSFTWVVKKIRIWAHLSQAEAKSMWVDAIFFEGGLPIDPIRCAGFYPSPGVPIYDSGSISSYGRRLLHHQDHSVRSFEQAYDSGYRACLANKEPIQKIVVKKGAAPYARPNQYVNSLSVPEYEITGQWRVLELAHDWMSKGNNLRTTWTLVPKTQRLGTEAVRRDSVAGLLGRAVS